jgi:hypothetical protein
VSFFAQSAVVRRRGQVKTGTCDASNFRSQRDAAIASVSQCARRHAESHKNMTPRLPKLAYASRSSACS